MPELGGVGKLLLVVGIALVAVGGFLTLVDKVFATVSGLGWLGKLPGDFLVKRDHVTLYFPLATSILISIVLSTVLYLVSLFFRR